MNETRNRRIALLARRHWQHFCYLPALPLLKARKSKGGSMLAAVRPWFTGPGVVHSRHCPAITRYRSEIGR